MRHGRVITVDIEKQHDLSHPRITYLIADCAAPETVAREMAAYAPLVTPGSYLHVQDGVLDESPSFRDAWKEVGGPLRAIKAFLPEHPEFEVDSARTGRFLITHHPKGWLRRKPET